MGGDGGKWGDMGERRGGLAHGMWVVEGCRGMLLRELGKWDINGTKMGRTTRFSQSHFPQCSGGRSPQVTL